MTLAQEPVQSQPEFNLTQPPNESLRRWWHPGSFLWRSLGVIGLVLALIAGYVLAGRPVNLVINGLPRLVRVHQLTVAGVLQEMNLTLAAEDSLSPSLASDLSPGDTVTIHLARPVTLEADGQTHQWLTRQSTAAAVLAEAVVTLNPRDEILINGANVSPETPLPPPSPAAPPPPSNWLTRLFTASAPRSAIESARPLPLQMIAHRAIPVTLYDGQARSTFYTTQPNVGEALLEQGLTLFLADRVTPGLGARLSPGMRVYIQRSIPVDITVDGHRLKTRTRRHTVGEALAQAGVALMGQDFCRPPANQPLTANALIEVVRVRETLEIQEEFLPFEARWIPDPKMELDTQEVRQSGNSGVSKKRTRARYENGQEASRQLEDEWLDQEPADRVIAYGTKIVIRNLDTETGPIEYWRKISMLSTAYSAATSGKSRDHPQYGKTRSGLTAGYGLVAVDPKVIPLMTKLYVPGYGPALAADTGGGVLGKHVDLGYDEDQPLPDMYEWRDVYVLTPAPSPDKIRYVLPQWPQRR